MNFFDFFEENHYIECKEQYVGKYGYHYKQLVIIRKDLLQPLNWCVITTPKERYIKSTFRINFKLKAVK